MTWNEALAHNALIAVTVMVCTALTVTMLHNASGLASLVLVIGWLIPKSDCGDGEAEEDATPSLTEAGKTEKMT